MYVEDLRPLKRPKLGFPDFYPQDKNQKEDQLSIQNLNGGLKYHTVFDDETGSALHEIQVLKTAEITQRINSIVDAKKRSAWGQDSLKKKNNLSRENFWPVPVGRNKKESASHWFQELAGTEPLDSLIRKRVPIFNKREEIFEVLFEKNVPVFRAVWYIKMTAAYGSLGAESKLAKKKQIVDPSFEWTVSLTKYMMECAWKICNPDSISRHDSQSSQTNASPENTSELARWKYLTDLSSWLYQENLLDRQEFLRWLIDRIETSKPTDDRSLVLYLPMALKYIKEISECVFLARPLVSFCCQKFAYLYEMQQKVNQFHLSHPSTTKKHSVRGGDHKASLTTQESMDTNNDDDDVFSGSGTSQTKAGDDDAASNEKKMETGQTSLAGRKRSKSGSLTVNIENSAVNSDTNQHGGGATGGEANEDKDLKSQDSCKHHTSLLLQLSCIIQLMAVQCPTAFIHISLVSSKGSVRDNIPKPSTPLDKLPMKLNEMPLPKKGMDGVLRKIRSSLSSVDYEIRKRAKAAESGWLAMTIADLQTSNKGLIVERVLSVLHLLDNHSFSTCKYHSPLSTLFVKITQTLKLELNVESYEPICMLLCQWAITPHRHGTQRPLVAARLLCQLQSYILQMKPQTFYHDLDALDESWEQSTSSGYSNDPAAFPFQNTFFQFLDTRGPVPVSLYHPLKASEPFFLTLVLFSELINVGVFSYPLYLSTLIARGEASVPIVPQLPFFRGEEEPPPDSPMESDSEELSLKISFPALPGLVFGGHSPEKKPMSIKREEDSGTISPSLPDRFGSQDNLLDPFDAMNSSLISHESSLHSHIKSEDSSSIFEMRKQKLENLADLMEMPDILDEGSSAQLVEFDSQPSSPKTDMFNDFQTFSPGMEDDNVIGNSTASSKRKKLDKHSSRHLLYAVYIPVESSKLSKQERVVVLCGTGRVRLEVETLINEIATKAKEIFASLHSEYSLVLPPSSTEFMKQFKMLPNFNQHEIASLCVESIMENLVATGDHAKVRYPSSSQLVFVCELLEVSGSFRKLVDLLVELVSFISEKKEDNKRLTPRLPLALCLPIVNLLWNYFPILMLSISDVSLVYEGFQRIIEGSQKPPKSSFQRAVFLFIQHLQTNCLLIKRTYPSLPNYFNDYCIPSVVDMVWTANILSSYLSVSQLNQLNTSRNTTENEPLIGQITGMLVTTPKNSFYFVCEVLSITIQKQTTQRTLSVLAQVCAEVSCTIDRVSNELLGGIRALCIPGTVYKACSTGFSHLTGKANVITDTSIHGNLITLIGLLVSFNCFTIHDIVTYIVKPIFKVYLLYPQKSGPSAHNGSTSLGFVSLLLRYLFVSDYILGECSSSSLADKEGGVAGDGKGSGVPPIQFPPFVQHCLLAKREQLSFETILNLLKDLLKLCKDTLRSSRGTVLSSKTGMSILVESFSSGSENNEEALLKLRSTLELIACQSWVREQCCVQGKSQLLELERLGDALSPQHAQYLLHLLIPYSTEDTSKTATAPDGSLPVYMMDASLSIERILKKLDQWTLRNAFLHLEIIINQQPPTNSQLNVLIDHLAHSVIQAFEDSCGNEWIGQTIDMAGDTVDEAADGAHSPSIWLVTPLISKLPNILGRVLKSAGIVLGRGQWWNQDKSMERKRSTRTTSVTSPMKTSLQWQQPFLELILACMNSHHSNHEELLNPLQKQLINFLTAFEKEGFPLDEQCKAMMYAALKLRLSLVGSMLTTVCSSENSILEWVSLLVQLICSGSVDRQPDNCELFTNCLDMLNALLQTLTHDFHMCMMSGGEDGKKNHILCIKKMKGDLQASKSSCKQEIQQLFPLPQKAYEVTTVKPPAFRTNDKIQGLRVQDTKEISPWEIIEGTRHSSPLQLSWFGATRTKRKPLRFVEQRRLIRFHTHHHSMEHMTASPYFLYLPKQQSSTLPMSAAPSQNAPGVDGNARVDKGNTDGEHTPGIGQGGANQSGGVAKSRTEIQSVLKTIEEMNKHPSKTNIPPLPPQFHPQQGAAAPTINPQMRPTKGWMQGAATGGGPMIAPPPQPQQPQQQQMPQPQIQPQAQWFNAFVSNMTPEQRNSFQSLSNEEKKMYLMNHKRRYDLHNMQKMMAAQSHMHPGHPGAAGPMAMNPHYRSHVPRHMVNPGVPMNHPGHGMSQPRPMMYPGMPPPSNHPAAQPGPGFMMPPGHHHPNPAQSMYRQSMYSAGGMPPQHGMMPGPYR